MASQGFLKSIELDILPKGFWKKKNLLQIENIKKWVLWFEQTHNITEKDDWYNVTGTQINKSGGSGFFTTKAENGLKESVYELLKFVYPEYEWIPWKFVQAPQGYWNKKENRLKWCEDFRKHKNIQELDEFYKYKLSDWEEFPGRCIAYYGDSLIAMLKELYPEHTWYEWRFTGQVTKHYWTDRLGKPNTENIRLWFTIEIVNKYNWKPYEDLYNLTQHIIRENYGGGLLAHVINGSPMKLLELLYPDHEWLFWKFVSAPNSAWSNPNNVKRYIVTEFNIQEEEDLYKYMISDFPSSISQQFTDMFQLCQNLYPSYNWDKNRFKQVGYSLLAIRILDTIASLTEQHIQHALNGGEYKIPGTKYKADGYIQLLNVILEFNGCYYHGCPKCYPDRSVVNKHNQRSHGENFTLTNKRIQLLKEKAYNVIEIWECEANKNYLTELSKTIR